MTNVPVISLVYGAYSTTDEYGHLGSCYGWFSTKSAAETRAIGIGWVGGRGSVERKFALTVNGQSYLLAHETPIVIDTTEETKEDQKRKVLSKLTPAEREILGFK